MKSCPNPKCSKYGKILSGNIIKFGKTAKGDVRYKCKACGKTFVEHKDSFFFYSHLSKEDFGRIARMLARKMSFRKIARKEGRHLDTVRNVGSYIRQNYERLKEFFLKDIKMSPSEFKEMVVNLKKRKKASKSTQKPLKTN